MNIFSMYLTKTPRFIQNLFPTYIWSMAKATKKVFITFDDGPIPEVTPWVLDELDKYNAKGTFFCVGDNIRKNPEVYNEVVRRGHAIGNHTFNHLSGWNTENIKYFHNIRKCARLTKSNLFRPPYGRIKPSQSQFLSRHYKIVMWDILSGDFDQNISAEECFQNVVSNVRSGSIIVFHDSLKSEEKLRIVLPRVLEYLTNKGYQLKAVEEGEMKPSQQKVPA